MHLHSPFWASVICRPADCFGLSTRSSNACTSTCVGTIWTIHIYVTPIVPCRNVHGNARVVDGKEGCESLDKPAIPSTASAGRLVEARVSRVIWGSAIVSLGAEKIAQVAAPRTNLYPDGLSSEMRYYLIQDMGLTLTPVRNIVSSSQIGEEASQTRIRHDS